METDSMKINRRKFLQAGLSGMTYFTTMATTPNWIIRSANALDCLTNNKILVIVQLAGGNDGLNTVIPRNDPRYYDIDPTTALRPNLHIPSGSEINMDGINGLHPRLPDLAEWYQKGMLAVCQNVGYVNPNLSHFTSTDFWELGYVPGEVRGKDGWIARFYDNECNGAGGEADPLFMLASGISAIPDSMEGSGSYVPPAIRDPEHYALAASQDEELRLQAIVDLNAVPADPLVDAEIDFLQRSVGVAEASAQDIAIAVSEPDLLPPGSYSDDKLGSGLKLASQIIRSGFNTRIFYVSQGGYDTHANQVGVGDPLNTGDHPELLATLNQDLNAFMTDMQLSGNLDRVLILTFSEFGRRVGENSSSGTDHGAANSLFVMGGQVQGGVYGGQPDLSPDILLANRGNLKHEVDFRSVYTRVIENWFGGNGSEVFGQTTYSQVIQPELADLNFLQQSSNIRLDKWTQYR